MPLIPFPDVPPYPGVPPLARSGDIPTPDIQMSLGEMQPMLASSMQSGVLWGVFDSDNNQLGISSQGAGGTGPTLSTSSIEFDKETTISDFPLEADATGNNAASFASYNKVEHPADPKVTLVLSGSESDRTAFLNAIDDACISTDLYSVVTPTVTYYNYSIESYNYRRTSTQGATMLSVEIALKEIRQVSAQFSTVQTPINQPQNPDATPQTNSGSVQPQSTVNTMAQQLPAMIQSLHKAIDNLFPAVGNN